jgi:hypothetical protein
VAAAAAAGAGDDYSDYYLGGAWLCDGRLRPSPTTPAAAAVAGGNSSGCNGAARGMEGAVARPSWHGAVAEGARFRVPARLEAAAAAAAARGGKAPPVAREGAAAAWRYPRSPWEAVKCEAFRDLHSRGCAGRRPGAWRSRPRLAAGQWRRAARVC